MAFATCRLNRNFRLRFPATSQSPEPLSVIFNKYLVKNYFSILLAFFLLSCNTQNIDYRKDNTLIVNDIASEQLSVINSYINDENFNKVLVDSIYFSNAKFWKGYLGDEKAFLNWFNEKGKKQIQTWNINSKNINPTDLTIKLNQTAVEMYKFTGFSAKGEWNILYGPAWTDLGGFDDGTMLIDLAHKSNNNFDHIINFYPHELNHQIYSYTQNNIEDIVLNRIIDEGFATYVSFIFHKKMNSAAKELVYSDDDFKFCIENEIELLNLLKDNYYKSDEELSRKFADRSYKFKENYPGAIGYYIGFRIIEEFVKHNGQNSWKNIYKMTPREVLIKSKILE